MLFCIQNTTKQDNYPVLKEIVTDQANLFSNEQLRLLREKLTAYETETTHQIVVLTINNIGSNTIEDYAYQVFNKNQLGQREADNGILILISKKDRGLRIEVGDGLTPIITDAFSSRIIRDIITPAFKEGDFYKGIDLGTSDIIRLIDSPEYREEFNNIIEQGDPVNFILIVYLILFLSIFLGAFFSLGKQYSNYGFFSYYKDLLKGEESILKLPVFIIINFFRQLSWFSFSFLFLSPFFMIILSENENLDFILRNFKNLFPKAIIYFAVIFFIIFPLIVACFSVYLKPYLPKRKRSKRSFSKGFSSSGISSSSSSSSFSSSSNTSFSGGGGSSSGGGASGSW